jgi:hypothetical protein
VPVPKKRRVRPRRNRPRSKTIATKRLTREELRIGALMYPPADVDRPDARADCVNDDRRPCPFVACKHHLYLDVNPDTGSIKINFPDLEVWEMADTCGLDVADRGGITLEEVGEIMNLTRERIRQVEVRGLLKLRMTIPNREDMTDGPVPPVPPTEAEWPDRVLAVLGDGEKTSTRVGELLGVSARYAGRQLRELERVGMVASRRVRIDDGTIPYLWRRAG